MADDSRKLALVERVIRMFEERAERLMPHDLVFSDVWHLKRPCTAAEFRAAFLVKSRLGRLLRR
jgi:hypothetical protein